LLFVKGFFPNNAVPSICARRQCFNQTLLFSFSAFHTRLPLLFLSTPTGGLAVPLKLTFLPKGNVGSPPTFLLRNQLDARFTSPLHFPPVFAYSTRSFFFLPFGPCVFFRLRFLCTMLPRFRPFLETAVLFAMFFPSHFEANSWWILLFASLPGS